MSASTENDTPNKQTKKLTQDEIREKRRRLREKRKRQDPTQRLNYIYNRVSKDDLNKPIPNEQNNESEIEKEHRPMPMPIPIPMSIPNMFDPNNSSGALDPNIEMEKMVKGMLNGLLGSNPNDNITPEQRKAKRKHEEKITKYDTYSHNMLCILFGLLLIFLPYDITILNYNLSSDSWTYFISCELILFSIFYGYKQYTQRKYNINQNTNNVRMNQVGGTGQLMTMFGIAGASFLGGGNEMSIMIQKWIDRGLMVWSYIEMLRQLISDLCLILFLWIVFTSIKTVFL